MWGYSFEDIAKRAQEEASRLAEQAAAHSSTMQSPGLFSLNLDSLNDEAPPNAAPEGPSQPSTVTNAGSDAGFFATPENAGVAARPIRTAPTLAVAGSPSAEGDGENDTDHLSSLATHRASPDRALKPAVTKLEVTADDDMDDFDNFDTWGDSDDKKDDIDDHDRDGSVCGANVDANNVSITCDVDQAAEQMKEESQQIAEHILREKNQTSEEEEDRVEEKEREEPKKIAAQIMPEEKQTKEKEAAKKTEVRLLEEECRFAEHSIQLTAGAERAEEEKVSAEEQARASEAEQLALELAEAEAEEAAERDRLQQECKEQEMFLAEEARLAEEAEVERQREQEEQDTRQKEQEEKATRRLEQEQLVAKEAEEQAELEKLKQMRLAEESAEEARVEAGRIERERLAAEEAANRIELEKEAVRRAEAERAELQRLAEKAQQETEKKEQKRLAAERAERRFEAERIERERLVAEAEEARLETKKLEQEKLEAEKIEQERLAKEARLEAEEMKQERLAAKQAETQIEVEKDKQREDREARLEALEAEQTEQEHVSAREADQASLTGNTEEKLETEVGEPQAKVENIDQERMAAEEAANQAERIEQKSISQEIALAEQAEAEQLIQEEIVLAEQRAEEERLAAKEAEQDEAEKNEQERLAKEARLEAEEMKQVRLAAKQAETQIEAENNKQREDSETRLEVEQIEQENVGARETEQASLTDDIEEKLETEVGEPQAKVENIDQERMAAEEAADQAELERIEQKSISQEIALAEQTEAERLIQGEIVLAERRAEEESLAAKEAEQERLAGLEADQFEQQRLLKKSIEQAECQKLKKDYMEDDRYLAEMADATHLDRERLAAEAERSEHERLAATKAGQSNHSQNETAKGLEEKNETGDLYDDELDDMYDDCDDSEDEKSSHDNIDGKQKEVEAVIIKGIASNEQDFDDVPVSNSGELYADKKSGTEETSFNVLVSEDGQMSNDNMLLADKKPALIEPGEKSVKPEQPSSTKPASAEGAFFDAAAAVTSSMWDTSGLFGVSGTSDETKSTASVWSSWGYNDSSGTQTTAGAVPAPDPVLEPVAENITVDVATKLELDSNNNSPEETSDQEKARNIDTLAAKMTTQVKNESSSLERTVDDEQSMPQHTLDNFMKQLERMAESHQLEMSEQQRMHNIQIDRLESELLKEREVKTKTKARNEVALQDKFLKQMRELEKKFTGTIQENEDALKEARQSNEEAGLKLKTLQKEVDGLRKIVDERDEEICRLAKGHGTTMMQVEGKVKNSQEKLSRKDNTIHELKNSVQTLQTELDATSDAYNTLKARAKAVATELKNRRTEVRNLSSENEQLSSANLSMDTQLSNLRALVNQHEITIEYKDKDMDALNEKVKSLNKQVKLGSVKSLDRINQGEKAIASYKRKAQDALAGANARLAAANQAREEAERDAKNARSASNDAVERARVAEMKKSEAEKMMNELTTRLDSEQQASSTDANKLKEQIHILRDTVCSLQSDMKEATDTKVKLVAELEQLNLSFVEQKEKNADLHEQLIQANNLCESLQREVHELNNDVQRSSAAAFKRAKDNVEGVSGENGVDRGSSYLSAESGGNQEESDGTIIMLQQELQGANEAISELKLALRTALLEATDKDFSAHRGSVPTSVIGLEAYANDLANGGDTHIDTKQENDSTPLYFAIEKQNELKTARDEINRLANMLGDAESAKQEALDKVDEMRQMKEEADSRLLRYEKLGMKQMHRPPISHPSSYGPFRTSAGQQNASGTLLDEVSAPNRLTNSGNDSVVNLEYLKNVMLSFLTAKTLADRRKLVPVVATVLCLTPEEQSMAIRNVEQTAGLTGVATSFWENLESKAHNLM